MSAPTTHDPIAVTTADGTSWLRRAVTGDGRGLYAVDGSCRCPEYLMATLAELAEHGIAGQADVLPVPVGPEPQALSVERLAAIREHAAHSRTVAGEATGWSPEEYAAVKQQLFHGALLLAEVDRLRARVAELEPERTLTDAQSAAMWDAVDEATPGHIFKYEYQRIVRAAFGAVGIPLVGADEDDEDEPEGPSPVVSADRLTAFFAPTQALREDESAEATAEAGQHVEWCTGCNTDHDPDQCGYRPESGGAS